MRNWEAFTHFLPHFFLGSCLLVFVGKLRKSGMKKLPSRLLRCQQADLRRSAEDRPVVPPCCQLEKTLNQTTIQERRICLTLTRKPPSCRRDPTINPAGVRIFDLSVGSIFVLERGPQIGPTLEALVPSLSWSMAPQLDSPAGGYVEFHFSFLNACVVCIASQCISRQHL